MAVIPITEIIPATAPRAIHNTMANAADLIGLIGQLTMSDGWGATPLPIVWNGAPGYRLTVHSTKKPDAFVYPSYVVVYTLDEETEQKVIALRVLDPNEAVNAVRAMNPAAIPLVWNDALGAAPTVINRIDGTTCLRFRRPNALIGPYSYQVKKNGVEVEHSAEHGSVAVTTSGEFIGVVLGADIELTVDVEPGDTFTVTITTDHGHSVTSAATAPIPEPEPEEP